MAAKCLAIGVLVAQLIGLCHAVMNDRPRLRCDEGHMVLEGGPGKNISLTTKGSGAVVINGIDVARSISLVSAVRPQLESLNSTDLGYLVRNLSTVAQTVASQQWISTTINGLKTNATRSRGDLDTLRNDVSAIRTTLRSRLDPLVTNVSRLSSQVSLVTPEGGQHLQEVNTLIQNLQQASTAAQNARDDLTNRVIPGIQQNILQLQSGTSDLPVLRDRVEALEAHLNGSGFAGDATTLPSSINRSIQRMRRSLSRLRTRLQRDECASGPCQNGATCIDGYMSYTCLCPKGWMGGNCDEDFNECYEFFGTDLGCQNQATCVNTPGSYSCQCAPGWYGVHCTLKSDSCSTSTGHSLCGLHGTCINTPRNGYSYSCICDEGWTQGNSTPACVDVNECSAYHPRCSHLVSCVNYPGGFACGPCPSGYSGNGFVCQDVDECASNNGGCSPYSVCYNTVGGRRCGPCSAGFTGDGQTCLPAPRPCQQSPCSPLATCIDNPQMSATYFQCICPPGYQGQGIGPHGCVPASGGLTPSGGQSQPTVNLCQAQPCVNGGTCIQFPGSYTYTCTCQAGYTGRNCEVTIDTCASNPCQNGGTCTSGIDSFTCTCPSSHTGDRCQTENQECGGFLSGTEGTVSYPGIAGMSYNHNISCAWVISVPRDQVINVTFGYFHLEGGGCHFDWLQVHDGSSSRYQMIGRYCGSALPGTNGTILSTHNQLYLWFRSDHSYAGNGFNFTWNSTDPVCGRDISGLEYGSINSPGYPGQYPRNRDCYWTIRVTPGKRIKLHFATLQMETHPNCSYDYLEVRDGLEMTGNLLQRYCSSEAPAPLTTSGSEVILHFHSDESFSDTGFHISFSAEPGIPGCGGLLTNDMGEFSPPTIDERYQHNVHCEWLIRVPAGEVIQLNFTNFHLEYSSTCRYDYVEIRDGGTADSPLMSKWCGRNTPTQTMSSTNELFVIFHSDHVISGGGFTATYTVACGGEYSGPTGLIRSPYHPRSYPHNRECVYLISQSPGKAIKLNFTDFDIEEPSYWGGCRYDYIEIRDGRRAVSPRLGRYCGPETHRPEPILSTHNFMWIKFVTDASISNRGFVANYTTIDTSCGGILRDLSGHINSPNSLDSYPSLSDCWWIVDLPAGYVIQLTWHTFALESHHSCDYDYVEVFDNSSVSGAGRQMGERYCGSTIPPIMTSSDNILSIHFHADHSVNLEGFSAIYHGIDASRMCGGHYHTQTGTITTPNYPMNYPHSRTCDWTITVPKSHQIRLIFQDVDIEPSNGCVFDKLEIRNGGYVTSPLLKTICSKNASEPDVFSHSYQLFLRFRSDSTRTFRGFSLSWELFDSQCGGELTAVSGEFISPGYPQPYHNNALCVWRIRVAQGSLVKLRFVDLELETTANCEYDFVEIRDGDNERSPLLGRLCSSSDGFASFNSTGSTMYVAFQSDFMINTRGFKAQYMTECNRVLTAPSGVIVTLNYPDPYPHDQNCTWVIKAPRGNSINASFSHFVLEESHNIETELCYYDYVELREGTSRDASRSVIGHYCRQRPPPPISTQEGKNILEVNFVSDYSVAGNGFRLEWVVNGCGGELTKDAGTFTSPNYPNQYPINTDCEWFIKTRPGTRIEITVHEFELESARSCIFDVLTIYGGPSSASPVLHRLCHQQSQPIVATTQGNRAFLSLYSDQSVRGKGFRASYRTLQHGCGGLFSAPEGNIHSPGYPNQDIVNTDCLWTLTVDPQHVVELNFTDFDIQYHSTSNCSYEFVAIYDGADTDAPELQRRCLDSPTAPAVIRSSGSTLSIRLVYNGTSHGRGFAASYKRGCGATVNVSLDERGDLVSPHYPHLFTSGLNCSWHLQAPEGSRIVLHIVHLDIQTRFTNEDNCTQDYLSVLDGPLNSAPEYGRYCGSHVPSAIISSARYLTVNMVALYGYGVGFRATYSVLTSMCGGDLTSVSGELASPHFPQPYPTSTECVWSIVAGPGNQVQLNFVEFDLEDSPGCNLDYIEIHEKDATGPLLLHNCSSDIPPTVTAHDSLWIKFKSDETGAGAKGFRASYSLVFGLTLRGDRGEVVSPLYPHMYIGGDVTWRISVPRWQGIMITFLDVAIRGSPVDDTCFSSLRIYGGYSMEALNENYRIATVCGYEIPADPIYTWWSTVFVQFHTGPHNFGAKFRFKYESVSSWNIPRVQRVSGDSNCSFEVTLNGSSQTIQNPGYPGYANNLNCEWVIQSQPHQRVRIMVSYQLEETWNCMYDKIQIYDGVEGTQNWNLTRTLCQRRAPFNKRRFISTGRYLRLTFTTDSSGTRRGFRATLVPICGGYLRDSEGVIKTPNYPENYNNGDSCRWTIKVGLGRTIRLEFDEFRVTNSTPLCGGDYLLIRNGGTNTSPFLGAGKYCGVSTPPVLESSSNIVTLTFSTDYSDTDKGFKLRYFEVADACGGSHRLTSDVPQVTITSPKYPNPPDPHTECVWVISGPQDKALSLHFEGHFEISTFYSGVCDQAFVEIRDGGTILSPLLNSFCGTTLPSTQHASGNIIYVRYFNNVTHPHAGFKAVVEMDTCGGTYNVQEGGVITTPNYPEPFPDNVNCTWRLTGPSGHYLTFSFVDMHLQGPDTDANCSSELGRVQIRDNSTDGDLLTQSCGTTLPPPVDTSSNVAVVKFNGSDNSDQRGFKLLYNVSLEECGGELVGPEGEIKSPGYPHGYARYRTCVWYITVPEGRKVSLEVVDVDLESLRFGSSYRYCRDILEFRNGHSDHAPTISSPTFYICHNDALGNTRIFNSSMNTLTVVFRSRRAQTNGRGFHLRWTSDDPQECGGQLPFPSGVISTPNSESGTYDHSLNCVWTLDNQNPTNSTVVIKINFLDLEDRCFDFLLVQGVTYEGEVVEVQRVCNDYNMEAILVPYPTTRISLVTDYSVNRTGFNLSYSLSPCGGQLHGPQSVIQTPNYPANYPDNSHCSWLLNYDEGEQIDFGFTDFRLENSLYHDFVVLYNGPRTSSPLLGRFTGSSTPGDLRSMTNHLLVIFNSDANTNDKGFRATANRHIRGCGGRFHGMSGNMSTHNFPQDYQSNSECEWDLDFPAGYHVVLTFVERFDVETSPNCQNDYLQISHSSDHGPHALTTWKMGEKFCGKQMPPSHTIAGTRVKLLLHSNEAVQGAGFKVTWEMKCGNNYTDPTGIILSPGYPGEYTNNLNCVYRIIAPADSFVRITFTHFELEGGNTCPYDSVVIEQSYNWRWRWRRSVIPYCGTNSPGAITTKGTTTITFTTDSSVRYSGFAVNYTIEGCGGNVTEPGEIELPTRPFYMNNMHCVWDITAPAGKVPYVKFQTLSLEGGYNCPFDQVSIYDGHTSQDANLTARFCGDLTSSLPIIAGKQQLTRLEFRSDSSVRKEGFKATVDFTYACGGTVNISSDGATQTIRSLDADSDGNYEPLLDCRWLVLGQEDHVINMTFTRLDLEPPGENDTSPCPYDYIKVYDGPSEQSQLINTYCNGSLPPPVVTATNVMYIVFRSDSANESPGFTATLQNVEHPCGASALTVTNQTQTIQSPGYPVAYQTSIRCRWILTAPEDNQNIHLEFSDLNLESSPRCVKDHLQIDEYSQFPRDARIISGAVNYYVTLGGRRAYFSYPFGAMHVYCGSTNPHTLNSVSNAVEVRFVSDESVTAPGFRMQYSIATCNRTYNGSSGFVRLSKGPCFTTFQAPAGQYVNIYFENFYIYRSENECDRGSLKIYDGSSATGTPLINACGWRVPNPVFSTGNSLFLHMDAEYSNIIFTYVTTDQANGCGGSVFVSHRTVLTSPSYPSSSASNLDCMFTVSVPQSLHVALRFYVVDFGSDVDQCNSTYLQLYDVSSTGDPTLFNTLCGGESNVAAHLAPSNRMVFRYATGAGNQTGTGWRIYITGMTPHEDTVFEDSTSEGVTTASP